MNFGVLLYDDHFFLLLHRDITGPSAWLSQLQPVKFKLSCQIDKYIIDYKVYKKKYQIQLTVF